MTERANVFGNADLGDLSDFTPVAPPPSPSREVVRKVAEKASFSSREPEKKRPAREPRSYRTGRNAQFTIKADPDVIAEFYAITEAEDWVLGETLEKAVLALKEQRASRSRAGKG